MTCWHQRLGDAGGEQMLRATIDGGINVRAIRHAKLKRINVDTTVQTFRPRPFVSQPMRGSINACVNGV